jgi:hypothetical protein
VSRFVAVTYMTMLDALDVVFSSVWLRRMEVGGPQTASSRGPDQAS